VASTKLIFRSSIFFLNKRKPFLSNSGDTSISRSKQLETAIPPSKISALSSGEFVGMVADDPDCKIDLKAFHCEILNDHEGLKREQDNYKEIEVIRRLDNSMVQRNYLQIKQDIDDIIRFEMERLINDPGQAHLVIRKKK
jgi:TusA-related sulfurtransferase